MSVIKTFGYMPGYGPNSPYSFTKDFDRKVCISIDVIDYDPEADFKVLMQSEPPNLWIRFCGMVLDNWDKYDLILTYDDRLLHLPNAREFCGVSSWISDDIKLEKQNQITYMMSSKINGWPYHMRYMILRKLEGLKKWKDFDFKMHRSPPMTPSKDPFFANAKFNIACENQNMTNMFSEKLLDCFKTYTVPIYFGCTNIEKYFNPKGILSFQSFEDFERIMDSLTPEMYDEMLPYVQENYELAKPYWEKNVYQRIEDEVEKSINLALEQQVQQSNLFDQILFD